MNFNKVDGYDQILHPGDVCAHVSTARDVEFVVYKGTTYGGKKSKGEFGRFITLQGIKTLRYRNVVFIRDPVNDVNSSEHLYNDLVKQFYEGVK